MLTLLAMYARLQDRLAATLATLHEQRTAILVAALAAEDEDDVDGAYFLSRVISSCMAAVQTQCSAVYMMQPYMCWEMHSMSASRQSDRRGAAACH